MRMKMKSTCALCLLACVGFFGVMASADGPATQSEANGDAQRLTFLGDQLSADEAAITSINKALKMAGYHAQDAADEAAGAAKQNELMDRKGGGPVPWQEFYGRTAKSFIMHDPYGEYHQVQRPDQFDYVYKANNEQIAKAQADIESVGKTVDALLGRRRQLEAEQSSLWATIAFEAIGNRDIAMRPLYRDQLAATPSKTDDNRPDGARVAAIRAAAIYMKTLDNADTTLSDGLETEQEAAYQSMRETMQEALRGLSASVATFTDTPGADPAEAKQMRDVLASAKRIQSVCKDICEAYRKAQEADAAGQTEEQRKLLFRGTLQESLFTFAEAAEALDDLVTTTAENWQIHGEAGTISGDQAIAVIIPTHIEPAHAEAANVNPPPVQPQPVVALPATAPIETAIEPVIMQPAQPVVSLNDNQIAEQVLQMGGRVTVSTGTSRTEIRDVKQLPRSSFSLVGVFIGHDQGFDDNRASFLSSAVSLESLNLRDTQITDQTLENVVSRLSNLREVDVPGTKISSEGLNSLQRLKHLQSLAIGRTSVSDLHAIVDMRQLTNLSLWGAHVTDETIQAVSGLSNLTWLCIRATRVTDEGLGSLRGLTQLTFLDITNTKITDDGLRKLSSLSKLTKIEVNKTAVSDAVIKQLFPNCQISRD